MPTFRKKPVEVEAIRWTGDNTADVLAFGGKKVIYTEAMVSVPIIEPHLEILTLDSIAGAVKGDWLIRGTRGELYPCRSDIFAETYESVSPAVSAES